MPGRYLLWIAAFCTLSAFAQTVPSDVRIQAEQQRETRERAEQQRREAVRAQEQRELQYRVEMERSARVQAAALAEQENQRQLQQDQQPPRLQHGPNQSRSPRPQIPLSFEVPHMPTGRLIGIVMMAGASMGILAGLMIHHFRHP